MRVDKIAKMLIGVENLVVQGVTYDEEQGCIVISARPTLPHARECGAPDRCWARRPGHAPARARVRKMRQEGSVLRRGPWAQKVALHGSGRDTVFCGVRG